MIIVITFYAGVLVWKDKDERMDEIVDATPVPVVVILHAPVYSAIDAVTNPGYGTVSGMAVQVFHGYHRFQLGLYAYDLFVRDFSLAFLSVLAFFIHAISPNKYIGYFAYIAFFVSTWPSARLLNIATNLVQFAGTRNRHLSGGPQHCDAGRTGNPKPHLRSRSRKFISPSTPTT